MVLGRLSETVEFQWRKIRPLWLRQGKEHKDKLFGSGDRPVGWGSSTWGFQGLFSLAIASKFRKSLEKARSITIGQGKQTLEPTTASFLCVFRSRALTTHTPLVTVCATKITDRTFVSFQQ